MVNELQQESHQQRSQSAPQVSDLPPAKPKKSRKRPWVIIGIGISILFICLAAIAVKFMAVLDKALGTVSQEIAPIELVLDSFMKHMVKKDSDSAYALYSPDAQQKISISVLEEMLEGDNYYLFEGYQNLSVSTIHISNIAVTSPDIPQGIIANISGVIFYENDVQGTFYGMMIEVGDRWMIYSFFISKPSNVPE